MLMGYWFDNSTFKFNGKYVGIITGKIIQYSPVINKDNKFRVLKQMFTDTPILTYNHFSIGYYKTINNVIISNKYEFRKE